MKTIRLLAIFLLTNVISAQVRGDIHETIPNSPAHTPASDGDRKVTAAIDAKCMSCHIGDGKFREDGLPSDEWNEKIKKAITGVAGTRQMPPPGRAQLTGEERDAILNWKPVPQLADTARPAGDICGRVSAGSQLNLGIVKRILNDSCRACHGEFTLTNPSSPLRVKHTQFLKNDGSLNFANLGDFSELPDYALPKDKTSFGRILGELTGYTMPPRQDLPVTHWPSGSYRPHMGTPALRDSDRKALASWIRANEKRENCAPKDSFAVISTGRKPKALIENYEKSATNCAKLGGYLPTSKQLKAIENSLPNEIKPGCLWTSTFSSELTAESDLKAGSFIAPRVVFNMGGDRKLERALFLEKGKCQSVCVK